MRKSLIKIKSWEFWPVWLVYLPVFFIWFFYAIRLRSFFFFTNVNPKIEMGGFAGESKMNILNQIPIEYLPKTFFVKEQSSFQELFTKFNKLQLKFPCIAKPDIGERGLGVTVCKTENELMQYYKNAKFDFIVQDFISYPIELAILYYRLPNNDKGTITSICQKDFLSVTGNGTSSIKELMRKDNRAYLQLERFEKEKKNLLNIIPKKDEQFVLEHIGNHNKGTVFLDKNKYIDNDLITAFDELSKEIPDLFFGRYDLKCNSIEELKELKNFSIIEINGVSAEPAHIYQPGFSLFKAEKQLLNQWKVLFTISKQQIQKGIKPMSFKCAIHHLIEYKKKINLHHN